MCGNRGLNYRKTLLVDSAAGPREVMSLFGNKDSSKKAPHITVQKTGRNIDDMLQALIEGAHDKDEGVRATIADSLADIGRYEPELMLSMCAAYLERNPKVRNREKAISSWAGVYRTFQARLMASWPLS